MDTALDTPVLIFTFNRPDVTLRTFESIRKVRPKKLYFSADGPRANRPDDIEKCAETRKIIELVDWPCEVKTLFHENNQGCFLASTKAVSWMLEHEEYGIVFDDDCVADPSFFRFCTELLEKYKNDHRVMHISGDNFLRKEPFIPNGESYYFSIIPHGWGWAVWRRSWDLFDGAMIQWPEARRSGALIPFFDNHGAYEYWANLWDKNYSGELNDWDAKLFFSYALHGGLCINPRVNLVTNIGFGPEATHAKGYSWRSNLEAQSLTFPLIHPKKVERNKKADDYTSREVFNVDNKLFYRLARPIKIYAPGFYEGVKKLLGK